MSSEVDICNLALLRIGVSDTIQSLTEATTNASVCNRAYAQCRDSLLEKGPWPFATAYATLALVAGTSSTPYNYDWVYAYRVPVDCLSVRRIVTMNGQGETDPPPFMIGQDSQGGLVLTSQSLAQIEYTAKITDPSMFSPTFVDALAWRVAIDASFALSISDQIRQRCADASMNAEMVAMTRAFNATGPDTDIDAQAIRDRV